MEFLIGQQQGPRLLAPQQIPVGNDIPVTKDCIMWVRASGRVTQEGIDKLIAYLQLIKGSFPIEGERLAAEGAPAQVETPRAAA